MEVLGVLESSYLHGEQLDPLVNDAVMNEVLNDLYSNKQGLMEVQIFFADVSYYRSFYSGSGEVVWETQQEDFYLDSELAKRLAI
jgi:hypothetical protein